MGDVNVSIQSMKSRFSNDAVLETFISVGPYGCVMMCRIRLYLGDMTPEAQESTFAQVVKDFDGVPVVVRTGVWKIYAAGDVESFERRVDELFTKEDPDDWRSLTQQLRDAQSAYFMVMHRVMNALSTSPARQFNIYRRIAVVVHFATCGTYAKLNVGSFDGEVPLEEILHSMVESPTVRVLSRAP